MADAAARREARQRKILENSEARLHRITGQTNVDGQSEEPPKRPQKTSPPNGGESVVASWKVLSEFQDEFPSTSQDVFPGDSGINESSVRRRNLGYTPNGDLQGHAHDDPFPQEQESPLFPHAENTTVEAKRMRESVVASFLTSRWIYVALAAVVNIMIVVKAEHLFGTTIIFPFLLIFISRMVFCTSIRESQSGSMLFAALILCNIRPEVIHRLKTCSIILSSILRELSFYLFSFVLIYYFFTAYWMDFEALAPNNVEVIVDGKSDL